MLRVVHKDSRYEKGQSSVPWLFVSILQQNQIAPLYHPDSLEVDELENEGQHSVKTSGVVEAGK